ncbi:MAG: DUF6057 family protein [Tannerellaceae bacterium]|nr:DUF6057 family protein [Tannerellaceae bacterium]
MKKHITIALDWGISPVLGISVWLFFAVFYRHHWHYQEQMQLFLFTPEYFMEQIVKPGGLSVYLGGFFTQFFYDSFSGAFGLSLLLVFMQRLVADTANHISRKPDWRLLSCIPPLLYACFLCNEDVLISGTVALVSATATVALYNRIGNPKVRRVFFFLMIPVLYFLIGMGAFVFVLLPPLTEWVRKTRSAAAVWLCMLLPGLLIFACMTYLMKFFMVQYPVERYWLAGDYYRFVNAASLYFLSAFLTAVIIPLLFAVLPEKKRSIAWWRYGLQLLLCVAVVVWGTMNMADWKKEELMAYDYYARTQKWNSILAMADKEAPSGPFTVSMLNLALAKTGYLPEYMFTYYQNGAEGLIPDFRRDNLQPLMAGEIYYHLGLVNTAQRYTFEAMEAIPDAGKSVRCIKRLVETNLINGRHEVAAKYLSLLKHTLFYRKWAKETKEYLHNEERINAHPEWGTLRAYRPADDFLFSETEKDQMLGLLFQHNPSNRTAYEYLLGFALLKKDLQAFQTYYRLGEGAVAYDAPPRSYQEALALIWSQANYEQALKPQGLSDQTVQRLETYRNTFTSHANPELLLKQSGGNTYWYYYHFGNK